MTKSRGILAPRQPWTAADDQVMRETYPDTLTRDLAARIGRTEKATHSRATGGGESEFIATAIGADNLPNGITAITRHRLAG